jgi:calcium-translocating P-type ATPase
MTAADLQWHAIEPTEASAALSSSDSGLTKDEAARRLDEHGPNVLEDAPPTHPLVVVLRQFRSPLIYILLAATVVTLLLEEFLDAAVIAAVLVLNATIGFTQERRAEGAVRALMGLVVPHARVVRDGAEWEIDSRELVPGDIVVLEPGARVPADLRLVWTNSLEIDESLLTGESAPVRKGVPAVEVAAPLADRRSMSYTGSVVTVGRGRGLVVATGSATELGAIAGLVRSEETAATPLQRRMSRFASIVGIAVGIASVLAFGSGVALGGDVGDMFLTAVALAVAAIPEGLPVVFTVTLAVGVRRMARRNAIVRRLPAVETLGSTTVIGSDKTGTLTENRMTVRTIWTPDGTAHDITDEGTPSTGAALRAALVAGVLANEADAVRTSEGLRTTGDPTEVALLVAAINCGVDPELTREAHPMFAEIPFESERRYAAAITERDAGDGIRHEVHAKGAPERIVAMCTAMLVGDEIVPIDPEAVLEAADSMAGRGERVLALAHRSLPHLIANGDDVPEPNDLVLVGLQGMIDPPRAGVREAIATCRRAGVRVVMITGDHAVTARAIADDLGIGDGTAGEVLTGADLSTFDDERLREAAGTVSVYARVAPEEKLRIVRALQDRGEVVAVTGDGVNDAPALKAAAIGVAMGKGGTDVAREAADMVLTDDDFVSIAAAVEEGRVTFENLRKATFFLVSTGVGTIFAILIGVWLEWPLIMLPAQLLWLNLVTNGVQDIALAFEPGEKGIVERPPRPPSEGVLSRVLWERALVVGAVLAAGTLLLFDWELGRSGDLGKAQTLALTTLVVFMSFHAGNSRSTERSLFRIVPWSNRLLLAAAIGALAIHIGALYFPPTQFVLRVEPLDMAAWVRLVPVAATVIVVVEIDKAIRRRMQRRR